MLNRLQKYRADKEQGFTLMELMVVILIIGILAAIAIPAFLNQRKIANDTALESDLVNAGTAMWSFMATEKKLGNQAVPATLPQSYLPLSKGTVLANSGTFDAFCIIGTNEGSNHTANGKDIPMAYDSTQRGLLTDGPVEGGACTASNLTPVEPVPEAGGSSEVPVDSDWVSDHGIVGFWNPDGTEGSTGFTLSVNIKTAEARFTPDDPSMKFESLRGMAVFRASGTSGMLMHFEPNGTNAVVGDATTYKVFEHVIAEPLEEGETYELEIAKRELVGETGQYWFDDRYNPPVVEPEETNEVNLDDAVLVNTYSDVWDSSTSTWQVFETYVFNDGSGILKFNDTGINKTVKPSKLEAMSEQGLASYNGDIQIIDGIGKFKLDNFNNPESPDNGSLVINFGNGF